MADSFETSPVDAALPMDRHGSNPGPGTDAEPEKEPREDSPAEPLPRNIDDVVFIMGIPQDEVTPRVHDALTAIMAEFDRIRAERDRLLEQNAYLQEVADGHSFLPVLNRRALLRELSRILARAERSETTSAFLYIQLLGLERVRQDHGRAVADELLVRVANIIRQELRESDVVGSMDSGDFGVVLPLIDAETAAAKAADVTAAIERRTAEVDRGILSLRARTGVYGFRPGDEARDVLAAADRSAGRAPTPDGEGG